MKIDSDTHIIRAAIAKRDSILIKSVLNGNKNSFAVLISLYKKRVHSLGISFFKNETDTEDFVQDVFLKAYTKLATFKGKSLFSTWLMRIAYTTALNATNRRKEYLSLSDDSQVTANGDTPEENEMRRLTRIAVQEALAGLPEKYAECLDMYFFYDISYADISEITAIPLGTVKSHIFRAKQILKKKLEDIIK